MSNPLNPTGIEWTDFTWNPVTGCKHNCSYCYARPLAEMRYPEGFTPTFRPERLKITRKKPATIFVCSMADLFGKWVPGEWIESIFEVMAACPQHTFLLLTKNPAGYFRLFEEDTNFYLGGGDYLPNVWLGATATDQASWDRAVKWLPLMTGFNTFVSAEPLLGPIKPHGIERLSWIIVGADSNRGAEKPNNDWADDLANDAEFHGVPVFVKDNWPWQRQPYDHFPQGWPQEFPEVMK